MTRFDVDNAASILSAAFKAAATSSVKPSAHKGAKRAKATGEWSIYNAKNLNLIRFEASEEGHVEKQLRERRILYRNFPSS